MAVINTNDTYKDYLWGLDNTGQNIGGTVGTVDKDIDAPEAWDLSEGDGVIVAVIDSGVAYNHPDLINNMWNGSGCRDDTGAALGGCNHGYDYENNDNTPLPNSSSHGTHVAGIIAAEKNNNKGIIGVAPQTKIMALKIGFGLDSDSIKETKAIDFAIQNGAKVINASYGGNYFSQTEYDAINRFKTAGGIFVASAGNASTNNDGEYHYYPTDYDLDNIISVAATNNKDELADFSNYGISSVDVAAPGVSIYSTIPSESTIFIENFNSVSAPNVPIGWVKGGLNNNFGTYYFGGVSGNVLYGDLNFPYANNANTNIVSSTYDLSNGGNISFSARCDTEYDPDYWSDYMALDISSDGTNFTELEKWDEYVLYQYNPTTVGYGYYYFENLNIPNEFRTTNFKFRFRWVTNASNNDYDGCRVDNIKFTRFSDGSDEQYDFMEGTSMAAPHVAGAVALMISANPTLSISQIKNNLLWSGDYSTDLKNKVLSNERINTYNAVYYSLNNDRPVYRFWSDQNQGHFYTANEEEKNYVINNYLTNVWRYEGVGYKSYLTQQSESVPLYRFWGARGGHHFYTANEDEKNFVIANYPDDVWKYEGIAFYVYPLNYAGESNIIYRFWSDQNQGHFYTASEDEKNYIIANYPERVWRYEGTAYKVVK